MGSQAACRYRATCMLVYHGICMEISAKKSVVMASSLSLVSALQDELQEFGVKAVLRAKAWAPDSVPG